MASTLLRQGFSVFDSEYSVEFSKSCSGNWTRNGTGYQPLLETGCDYLAIELGENLADYTQKKFKTYDDFYLVKGDFESYDFGFYKFDLIFSASTIQWILEQIAFSKTYELLKKNGMLAMMMLRGDYKTPNEALYYEIQKVYAKHFHPETPYTQKINYGNVVQYGFADFQRDEFRSKREFSAQDYVEYLGTHCDHIVLKEPDRSIFYQKIKEAILHYGDRIVLNDMVILYFARKP